MSSEKLATHQEAIPCQPAKDSASPSSAQPDFQQRIELHGAKGTIILEGTENTWIKLWETEDEKRA